VARSKFKAFLENAPVKLTAIMLFAILVPSVLVTAVGLVAVFQADLFVRDRFSRPIREKVARLRENVRDSWAQRLGLYADYLSDAGQRVQYLREIAGRDPHVRDVLISTAAGLEIVPDSPPAVLESPETSAELEDLGRLELTEKNDAKALAECQRLLGSSRDDGVLLQAMLAASRLSYRMGKREDALAYLRTARARFASTLDSVGIVREIPLLWRILEIERESSSTGQARETAGELSAALSRYGRYCSPDMVAFYRQKLLSLGDGFRPVPPVSEPSRPIGISSLQSLAALLPTLKGMTAGQEPIRTHGSLEALGDVDFVSFRPREGDLVVHLLLDRETFLSDVRAHGAELGLTPEGIRGGPPGEPAEASRSIATILLPAPLENVEIGYVPKAGELPEEFRGFNVLTLASFTWAVIVLVVTIVVGVLITLRSVLREMRTARMKSDFVSFVSHELKTPLTAIRMFTETILANRVENEEETRLCIQMIDRESERLSKLIDQILEFSRIEKHQKEFKFTSCDMESVVREAVKIFQDHNRMEPREIEINSVQHISKIKMDRAAMIELFLNLLSNAAKYSSRDKKIAINLRESIDDITVEVIDQGMGIRKRDQKKVFDKFFRAEDYLTRDVEGTGLGLTFARYIAKVHNGDIKVSSQLNSGSTFALQLRKTDVLAE